MTGDEKTEIDETLKTFLKSVSQVLRQHAEALHCSRRPNH
jgi:hypothetical protein